MFVELLYVFKMDWGELFLVGIEVIIVMGQINMGFMFILYQISFDVLFYCFCQYGQFIYIGLENGFYFYSFIFGVVECLDVGIFEELVDVVINDISCVDGVLWVLMQWDLV